MDIFNIYLPVAQIEFNLLLLILLGFCVGVLGGFFGVGGGWIITPALNIFGFHMAYAIGTDLTNIFGQAIIATKKHQKMGNIDWKLGLISVITSIIGLEIGSRVILMLEKFGEAGIIVRWCYLSLLLSLGVFMLYDYFIIHPRQLKEESEKKSVSSKSKISEKLHRINIPPMISLPASGIDSISLWVVLIIFLFTGFLSGFLGVGGGFMIMPALVYLIGLPTVIAVGTSLVTVLFSGAYGCFTYALKGRVEIIAALCMFIGASIGAQFGATAVKYIRGYGIRLLFAIMIIFASFSIVIEQVYKITMINIYQTFAAIIILGTATLMAMIIISRLFLAAKRERWNESKT